ncbi:13289_t:CDS:2 [Gigaspora margarita]|uniref:13289_t:CDS:1 n=1 Tax=Gigaspora margarita TaxID=4874 RepID=A0ABN7UCG0_GIGMA|nr:13289_t:CDS:2 [Gigaspora margarita]
MATKEKHDVWSYFPFINETTRKCSECSKTYEVPLYPSTAKSHIMSNHPEIWLRIRTRPGQYINNKKKKKRTKSNIIYSDISTTTSVTATPLQKGLNNDKLSMKNIMIIETEDNSEVMIETLINALVSALMMTGRSSKCPPLVLQPYNSYIELKLNVLYVF